MTRLDLPPSADQLIALPNDFGRRFLVTVDTEEEFDWSQPFSRKGYGTDALRALPHFQRKMEDARVQPLYLANYAIATDPAADCIADWVRSGRATVGAHMHPWTTPPDEETISGHNSFAGNLPRSLERAKLIAVTEAIEALTGERPRIFRAGRYGVGPNTADILLELGYTVDVSVRSRFNYRREGGPDFTHFPPVPWWISRGNLLEVPLSGTFSGPSFLGHQRPNMNALMVRLGLAQRWSLTPEGMEVAFAKAAVMRLLDEGVQLISLSLHSPSLEAGHTPYVSTLADLEAFWRWWDQMLDFFVEQGIASAGIGEVIDACARAAGPDGERLPGRPATSL